MSARDKDVGCTIVACFLLALLLYLGLKFISLFLGLLMVMILTGDPVYQMFAIALVISVVYVVCTIMSRCIDESYENMEADARKEMERRTECGQWTVEDFIELSVYRKCLECKECPALPKWLRCTISSWPKNEQMNAIKYWLSDPECIDSKKLNEMRRVGWFLK